MSTALVTTFGTVYLHHAGRAMLVGVLQAHSLLPES